MHMLGCPELFVYLYPRCKSEIMREPKSDPTSVIISDQVQMNDLSA
jgi:hypothetical protein